MKHTTPVFTPYTQPVLFTLRKNHLQTAQLYHRSIPTYTKRKLYGTATQPFRENCEVTISLATSRIIFLGYDDSY